MMTGWTAWHCSCLAQVGLLLKGAKLLHSMWYMCWGHMRSHEGVVVDAGRRIPLFVQCLVETVLLQLLRVWPLLLR